MTTPARTQVPRSGAAARTAGGGTSATSLTARAGAVEPGLGDLEVVVPDLGSAVRWARHGYPSPLARWHHHPEVEFHLIRRTHGQMMAGNRTVDFAPGQVSLMGAHLPHNWLSDLAPGEAVADRDVVCQVLPEVLADAASALPELQAAERLWERARRGILLSGASAQAAGALLIGMGERRGLGRLGALLELIEVFLAAPEGQWCPLVEPGYVPALDDTTAQRVNAVLGYIEEGIGGELSMTEAARIVALSPSAFSRFFHAAAGLTFSELVRRRRVARACHLLRTTELPVSRVAELSGYTNLANFNRRFRQETGGTPSSYRAAVRG